MRLDFTAIESHPLRLIAAQLTLAHCGRNASSERAAEARSSLPLEQVHQRWSVAQVSGSSHGEDCPGVRLAEYLSSSEMKSAVRWLDC